MPYQAHRVRRGPKGFVPLPRDKQQGETLIAADGTVMVSTWHGYDPLPGLPSLWPDGLDMCKNERPRQIRAGQRR